jgi:cytochrome P450
MMLQPCTLPMPDCRVQESLRKYSVVPVVVRELSEADQLEGHSLPAGTTVICHLQASLYTVMLVRQRMKRIGNINDKD